MVVSQGRVLVFSFALFEILVMANKIRIKGEGKTPKTKPFSYLKIKKDLTQVY